jgi:tRNA modification GTPase
LKRLVDEAESVDTVAYKRDTIAALATAPGRAGIGIVRISGPDAAEMALRILGGLPEQRIATFSKFASREGTVLDQGIALYFRSPDSFTGEDVLELQGHGGPVVLDMILSEIVGLGARIAEPRPY